MILADIIYPAFFHPYAVQLFMPLTGVAALTTEVVVFVIAYRKMSFPFLFLSVLSANVVSSVVGIFLASVLPSGLDEQFAAHGLATAQTHEWVLLAALSWFAAAVISILIEYPVLRWLTRKHVLRRLFLTVVIANTASYVVLYQASRLGFWLMWRR
jgi:hypothetical protein